MLISNPDFEQYKYLHKSSNFDKRLISSDDVA